MLVRIPTGLTELSWLIVHSMCCCQCELTLLWKFQTYVETIIVKVASGSGQFYLYLTQFSLT